MNLGGRQTACAPEGLISASILPQTVLLSSCRIRATIRALRAKRSAADSAQLLAGPENR
jgi:hypothetical protein